MIALQKETADYKRKITEQQEVISGLRRDLAGASARLSDMTGQWLSILPATCISNSVVLSFIYFTFKFVMASIFYIGEMSEAQKEEIEQSRLNLRKQESELTELRQQMAKLSTIIDKQSEQVRDLSDELK